MSYKFLMKNSKIQLRGYIFAREIENNIVPHKVQNLVIDFSRITISLFYLVQSNIK